MEKHVQGSDEPATGERESKEGKVQGRVRFIQAPANSLDFLSTYKRRRSEVGQKESTRRRKVGDFRRT